MSRRCGTPSRTSPPPLCSLCFQAASRPVLAPPRSDRLAERQFQSLIDAQVGRRMVHKSTGPWLTGWQGHAEESRPGPPPDAQEARMSTQSQNPSISEELEALLRALIVRHGEPSNPDPPSTTRPSARRIPPGVKRWCAQARTVLAEIAELEASRQG